MINNNLYNYRAIINYVYDGDGIYRSTIDLGIGIQVHKHLRLYGVDCPELRGNQHIAGIVVRNYVRRLILDKEVIVSTHKDKVGKYGRLLVDVHIDGLNLADDLISLGYAKPYFGKTKDLWTYAELVHIINNPFE